MLDLVMPGRTPESCDYEAQSALRTLLEAEKLKGDGDTELLDRVCEQVEFNLDMLGRVLSLVEEIKKGGKELPKSRIDKLLAGKESRYE